MRISRTQSFKGPLSFNLSGRPLTGLEPSNIIQELMYSSAQDVLPDKKPYFPQSSPSDARQCPPTAIFVVNHTGRKEPLDRSYNPPHLHEERQPELRQASIKMKLREKKPSPGLRR